MLSWRGGAAAPRPHPPGLAITPWPDLFSFIASHSNVQGLPAAALDVIYHVLCMNGLI
jgi:hypothetical protein